MNHSNVTYTYNASFDAKSDLKKHITTVHEGNYTFKSGICDANLVENLI